MNNKITLILIIALTFIFISNVSANDLNDTDISDFEELSTEINLTDVNQTYTLEKDYKTTHDSKQIIILKSITIDGNNHCIEAPDVSRVFLVKADNVCIKNINFINSNSTHLAGGAISWLGDNGTLNNCNFTDNKACSGGGAVFWKGNDGIIDNCNFKNNHVDYGKATGITYDEDYDPNGIYIAVVESEGGAICIEGSNILVNNCKFENNTALLDGGAISIKSSKNVTVSNSRFKDNKAKYNGGAIEVNGDDFNLINSTFKNNSPNDLFNNCFNTTVMSSNFKNESCIETWYNITFVNVNFKDVGFFDELSKMIDETPVGGILVLDNDYEYLDGSNKGILINKSITIDGDGHYLDGKHISRMFNITSDNVTVKNVNFINGNAFGRYFTKYVGGGAIYWSGNNGYLENCSFINNTGSGIEDDPFDKEETIVTEDGMIIHTVRVRPMGAKINEGGAIVWNGTNGTVSKCKFTNNGVGYPNTGGAICWRGDSGKIIGSEFYKNDAWCGSAIAWIGNNGSISYSKVMGNGFFDGGIYWFGDNGSVKYSILIGNDFRAVLRPSNANLNADYNFWGDTLEHPNQQQKIDNVTKWFLMSFSNNNKFVQKGELITIDYEVNMLYDNKKITTASNVFNYSQKMKYTANKAGFLNITFKGNNITVEIDSKDHIASNDLTKYYSKSTSFKVKVYDVSGKVIGKYVKFTLNKKTYKIKTDKNGLATLKLKLKPGKYTVCVEYGKAKVKNKITIKKTLITKNIVKKVKKSGKFTVKVLNSKGKVFKKQIVKIKFRGKTYKIKTNLKGLAIFKLSKNLKKGKYVIKTTYNSLTVTNKITVKK